MKKSTKAILLSALGCPGAGQLYLKHYVAGSFFMSVTLIALYLLMIHAFEIARHMVDDIVNGKVSIDIMAITQLISQQVMVHETLLTTVATGVLIMTWVISLVQIVCSVCKKQGS